MRIRFTHDIIRQSDLRQYHTEECNTNAEKICDQGSTCLALRWVEKSETNHEQLVKV